MNYAWIQGGAKYFVAKQGDQIGLIFACDAALLKIAEVAQIFCLHFYHGKSNV
jgi:hypothetical protein